MKRSFWNLISCLKNGSTAKRVKISNLNTKTNLSLLNFLWNHGYITGYRIKNSRHVEILLKYSRDGNPSLNNVQSISKPSKRIYMSANQFWKLNVTNTFLIVSTNQGLKSLEDCKKQKLGGEILAVIK